MRERESWMEGEDEFWDPRMDLATAINEQLRKWKEERNACRILDPLSEKKGKNNQKPAPMLLLVTHHQWYSRSASWGENLLQGRAVGERVSNEVRIELRGGRKEGKGWLHDHAIQNHDSTAELVHCIKRDLTQNGRRREPEWARYSNTCHFWYFSVSPKGGDISLALLIHWCPRNAFSISIPLISGSTFPIDFLLYSIELSQGKEVQIVANGIKTLAHKHWNVRMCDISLKMEFRRVSFAWMTIFIRKVGASNGFFVLKAETDRKRRSDVWMLLLCKCESIN